MAAGDQERQRHLATDCQRHPPAGADFGAEAATHRGAARDALHRHAGADGGEGVRPHAGGHRAGG